MTEKVIPARSALVLDASVAINIFASGQALAILRAWPAPCLIERRTHAEVHVLRDRESGDPRAVSSVIDWESAQRAGVVEIVDLADDDLHRLVTLSIDMDPGEAAAGAYSAAHQLELAIDDRKARRILERYIPCRWSLELVQTWARDTAVSDEQLTTALKSIRRFASWKPHAGHPLGPWWDSHVPS